MQLSLSDGVLNRNRQVREPMSPEETWVHLQSPPKCVIQQQTKVLRVNGPEKMKLHTHHTPAEQSLVDGWNANYPEILHCVNTVTFYLYKNM